MTSHRNNPNHDRLRAASASADRAWCTNASAQVIRFKTYQTEKRYASEVVPSAEDENSLAILKAELTMAIGISQGLGETLAQFQGYLAAIDDEIESGDVLNLKASIQSQATHLRSTVLAAVADWHRVLPAPAGHTNDVT